jgi:hypothetical protein
LSFQDKQVQCEVNWTASRSTTAQSRASIVGPPHEMSLAPCYENEQRRSGQCYGTKLYGIPLPEPINGGLQQVGNWRNE